MNDTKHNTKYLTYLFGNLNSSEFSKAPERVPPHPQKASED